MAHLFAGSAHPFNVDINGGSVAITTGEGYSDEYLHEGFEQDSLKQYPGSEPVSSVLLVDGAERKYFVLVLQMEDYYDCFMSPMDLAMILDVDMDIGGSIGSKVAGNDRLLGHFRRAAEHCECGRGRNDKKSCLHLLSINYSIPCSEFSKL
jgi:hypothetical protein